MARKKSSKEREKVVDEDKSKIDEKPKKEKKRKSFWRSRFFLIIVSCLFGGLVVALIISFFLKPSFEIPLESEEVSLGETEINSASVYPKFEFETDHKINFSNGKETIAKNYQTRPEDFTEGVNIIKVKPIKDFVFVQFEGKESKEYRIEVDREAPEISLSEEVEKFEIIGDEGLELKLNSEIEADLWAGESELGSFESEEQYFTIPAKVGENDIEIYAKDSFGNISDKIKLAFKADRSKIIAKEDFYNFQMNYLDSWELSETSSQEEYSEGVTLEFKKENAEFTVSMFKMYAAFGPMPGPCTNNLSLLLETEDADYSRIRITKDVYSGVDDEGKIIYKYLPTGTMDLEDAEDTGEGWRFPYHTESFEDFKYCIPFSFVNMRVEFDGEVDQELLKEVDWMVFSIHIPDQEV